MEKTTEVQELSLEKVIETKLIQNNVTESVLSELKVRYGNLKLKSLDDKESYLELKTAAKDCAKIRNLTTKVCKAGREDAVKVQKMWVAEEKRVILRISEVEVPLDTEIAKYDAEVDRKDREEKERKEEAYINRQAVLTKMGAHYENGNFILGEASYESELIKLSDDDVWEEAIIPKFKEEYEKIEVVRIAEQKKKDDAAIELKRQQDELFEEQEAFRLEKEALQKKMDDAAEEKREMEHKEQLKKERIQYDLQTKRFNKMFPYNPTGADMNMNSLWVLSENDFEEKLESKKAQFEKNKADKEAEAETKRLKDIEDAKALAIQQEKQRLADQEIKRQAELEASKDKIKWEAFIASVSSIELFEMRSGQYRRRMQIAKEKIDEILSL